MTAYATGQLTHKCKTPMSATMLHDDLQAQHRLIGNDTDGLELTINSRVG